MTSVDAETIVAGNPAKFVGKRTRDTLGSSIIVTAM